MQYGGQFFILAVHFNSLRVVAKGAEEIFLVVLIVTFSLINLSNCCNEVNKN